MYGSPTTKELKKKHSSRPVGGTETGSRAERTYSKAAAGGPGQARRCIVEWVVPYSCADNSGGTNGEQYRPWNPGLQHWGNKALKPLTENTCGGWGSSGRNSQTHRTVCWRDPQVPRMYTNPLTQESAPEGLDFLVGSGESDWKPAESWASGIVPSLTLPHIQCHNTVTWVARPWQIPKALPLTTSQVRWDKEIWPKWKKWSKLQKKNWVTRRETTYQIQSSKHW